MKKIAYLLFTLLLITSCQDKTHQDESVSGANDYEDVEISFGVSGLDINTRSFMDDVAVTEPWESELFSLRIYVFDQDDKYVNSYLISSSDIENRRTILKIPREATGQYCSFFAIANGAGTVTNIQYNQGATFFAENIYCNTNINKLNGELDQMLSGELYSLGSFPISGSAKVFVNPYGYLTEAFIPLKRIIAKVALEWRVDPDFSKNHDGAVVVVNNPSCYSRNNGYTFDTGNPRDYNSVGTYFYQTPVFGDGWNHNLWYVYEGKTGQYGENKTIKFTGIFDKDGDLTTTHDQHTVTYSVPIDYVTGENTIKRNTVYRIQATIKGLGADNLEATWVLEDWDVPPVHTDETGLCI